MNTEQIIFNEGVRLRFYLSNSNNRGWSVVYMLAQVGDKRLRISTMMKVRKDYWQSGVVVIPSSANIMDRYIHEQVTDKLNNIKNLVYSVIFKYCCNTSEVNVNSLATDITNTLKKNRMAKKETPKPIIALLRGVVLDSYTNEKSAASVLGIISTFERFLKESKTPNNIESLTQQTIRNYRDWLVKSDLSAARGKQCLAVLNTQITRLERKQGYDFNLNFKRIEPIKELRTMTERRKNSVALTHEEIGKLLSLELNDRLTQARDLFVMQCWCGVRFEDLNLLTNRDNLQVHEGITFAVFETQKKRVMAHIPLDLPSLYPQALELVSKYHDVEITDTKGFAEVYNRAIKRIAKLANLNREVELTQTVKGKVVKETCPIYDCISSHDGRHTFITNCQRYKHLTADQIKHMSGHTDTTMINNVYTNVETVDTLNMLTNLGSQVASTNVIGSNAHIAANASHSNNYLIEGITEARSVCNYLGIGYSEDWNFETLIEKIGTKQIELAEHYGVPIEVLKSLFGLTQPIHKRVKLLHLILENLI